MVIKERYLTVKELAETGSFALKKDALRQYLSRGEFAKFRNGKYYLYNEELVCTFKDVWRNIKEKKHE